MNEYLKPPFKDFVKTETGKITKTTCIQYCENIKNDTYIVWDEINYGTIATFKERVVATADTKEELYGKETKKYIYRRF